MAKIKRALISVSDKTEIIALAHYLTEQGVEILSTGGTEALLKKNKIPVRPVGDYTGFPEMMDGRVKTLHPKVHGGILNLRDNAQHQKDKTSQGIEDIDLVVVNLYPFAQTIKDPEVSLATAIENIDIGGPTMVRSAAKNWEYVAVVVDPGDYDKLKLELENNDMGLPREFRFELAVKAFAHTAAYDGAISNYLSAITKVPENSETSPDREEFSRDLNLKFRKIFDLRYGENPHLKAAYYSEGWHDEPCVGNARQLHGKHLSFNNFLDLDGALETVKEFEEPACVVVKHTNPCGVGTCAGKNDIAEALEKALACDPTSAFGGIIAFNREVSLAAAKKISEAFYECIIAPDFHAEALALLTKKQNLRLLKTLPIRRFEVSGWDMKKVVGGMLVQERDVQLVSAAEAKVVSERSPSSEELKALDFAWRVVKHVKSNAIVYAHHDRTVGIGAGQMSRVDAAQLGVSKAQSSLKGTVLASDAFFPFRDGVDAAAQAGVTAIIQPGGSIRDEEVIQAANEHNLAMVFTGMRHFRH